MGFNGRLVMQVLLTISLVLVSVFQGAMLDAFLIDANPSSPSYYFWLLPDFVVAILFFCTMWRSYGYWKKSRGLPAGSEFLTKRTDANPTLAAQYRWLIGYHPLGYLSWFCYSSVLVAKIVVIFKSEIINFSDDDFSVLGSQMMTLNLGLTALVFFLLVKGHHDSLPGSYSTVYISSLIHGTTMEIFDSIYFLSILYVDGTDIMLSYTL